jgi:K+-sensing histidine kinase KdpD
MVRRRVSPPIVRWLSGLLASVMMVAGVSALVAFLNPRVPPLHLLVLYLLVIMPLAIVWGTGLAVLTAVLSAAVYAFMFLPALQSLLG